MITLVTGLGLFTCCWLILYIDSVNQQHKAESLVRQLKELPFPSANFVQVRDFVLRHGGAPQQAPLPFSPPTTVGPYLDEHGKLAILSVYSSRAATACTAHDCILSIRIEPTISTFHPGIYRWGEFFYRDLHSLGLRPWMVNVTFEVREDKLQESRTMIAEITPRSDGNWEGLILYGYEVRSLAPSIKQGARYDYVVWFPHITGPPQEVLTTMFVAKPGAPLTRAFDINITCLMRPFRSCSGFGELAPSAWADYLTEKR